MYSLVMSERETLDEIFGETPMWKSKYKVKWCELCETAIVVCPTCGNTSCNSGGCDSCNDDFDEFNKSKSCIEDYLNEDEMKAYYKARYLKDFILKSLGKGELEIDFKRMEKDGELSQLTREMFSDRLV